jgi:hypothetical protein
MATTINPKTKPLSEIIQQECTLRQVKEINLVVFNHGVRFEANKISMYFREGMNKYIIVLQGHSGYLVNTEFEPHHGQSEFLFLCLQDEAKKKKDPVLINFFTYTFYDKNMEEVIDGRNNPSDIETTEEIKNRQHNLADNV